MTNDCGDQTEQIGGAPGERAAANLAVGSDGGPGAGSAAASASGQHPDRSRAAGDGGAGEESAAERASGGWADGIVQPGETPTSFRSGFVAVVGRPNVGKSTLVNALVGEKVAITSKRPETTRRQIRGIIDTDRYQVVLVDTPGLHRPRTLLGERLNDLVRESLADVDLAVVCLPADQAVGPGDRFLLGALPERLAKVAAVTKIDRVRPGALAAKLTEADALADWQALVPVSAVAGAGGRGVAQLS
ncbi:MAG: 50S ribosome-binding GTPase, partial [Bifidobacteriaceae bacterium]|nr:50S ribosome-binding GTPase [Bifidobacteriaceae bacterium]